MRGVRALASLERRFDCASGTSQCRRVAATAAVEARFLNAGQVCTSNERTYVHEAVYERFIELVTQKINAIKVPEGTGNLSWGGEDWHTLFIPSSTSVYAIRTTVGPRREPYMRQRETTRSPSPSR